MLAPVMRTACLAFAVLGCHASATVERTMPVANLQTYRTLALRVHTSAFAAQGQALMLENSVLGQLRGKCQFAQIGRPGQSPADLVLDLNVTSVGRGGGGILRNQNQATLDTLLVLTDGQDGNLLGTAKIHGQSSGVLINNGSPEAEAIDAVAKSIAELMSKSGCSGPRIARQEPPPPPPPDTGSGSDVGAGSDTSVSSGSGSAAVPPPPPPDETRRNEAEALNNQGKEKLYAADLAGALAAFQQANSVVPDPKYQFNVCLTLGAQEQFDRALAACQQARGMYLAA